MQLVKMFSHYTLTFQKIWWLGTLLLENFGSGIGSNERLKIVKVINIYCQTSNVIDVPNYCLEQ